MGHELTHHPDQFASDPVSPRHTPTDPMLFRGGAIVLVALLPLLTLTPHVWVPATAVAILVVVLFAVRRRSALRLSLVPWRALGIAIALVVLFETATHTDSPTSSWLSPGEDTSPRSCCGSRGRAP